MELERLHAQRLRPEISMLPYRPHVRNGDCSIRNQLSQEVMAHIDVFEFELVTGFCDSLSSNTGARGAPSPDYTKASNLLQK